MPWEVVPIGKNRWYQKPLIWAGVAAIACLLLLVMPRVQARYRAWSERRAVGRAVQAYNRGDFSQAMVDAKGVLKKNPHSGEATRIIAKSLEALNSPQALAWRRELDTLQGGDAENLLSLANSCVKTGDFPGADRVLKRLKPEDQKSARFHAVAAKIARHDRDISSAETHWLEAVRLEPGNDEYRLLLASVQTESRVPATRIAALAFLEKMTANPIQRIAALRMLLADSVLHGERSRTRELAETLAADPAAEFADKLVRLGMLRTAHDPQSSAYLAELQKLATPQAESVYKLMSWMNENNLALAVVEWESKLDPEQVAQPPICAALAEAYARAADWKGLKAKIENATWTDMEFLRLAFLSRTLEHLDDPSAANAAWNNALVAAQAQPEWLEMLGRVTRAWGWKQRAEETLWKLTGASRCPRWAAEFLWSAALARKDTAKLYEASKLLAKLDPANVIPRNNYIALALLTGQSADSPHEMAASLYQQNPKQVEIASTYGLSLFQQGRAAEAVAVMERFSEDELRKPQTAFYYAIFLAATGQAERADDFFVPGAKGFVLPEEEAMFKFLAPACRARTLDRQGDAGGSGAAWTEAVAATEGHPEWLEMLGKLAFDWQWEPQTGAVVMKLASLERCPAWAAGTLWKSVVKNADSAQIHRAGRLISKADPANLGVRSRYLCLSLLTGREVDAAPPEIAALIRANPKNVEIAATQGLSLYKQGKANDAVALMKNFPNEQLLAPNVALYPGLFLASTGKRNEAEPFLQVAAQAPLLAEERVLLARAQAGSPAPTFASAPVAATPAPTAPMPAVTAIDRAQRDTLKLFKEAREILLSDPKNVLARSNYVLLALLTGQSADSARQLARALYKEHPENASAAACHGLSLFQQGKADEALAVMETLRPEQLREPLIALYYGRFLAGSEHAEKMARAGEYLSLAKGATLLPEEEAFLRPQK